jgi:hypothetical protein
LRAIFAILCFVFCPSLQQAAELLAGVAKVDITDYAAGPVHDACYARALVLKTSERTVALVAVDAVAVAEIGRLGNGFMAAVRAQVKESSGIDPENVLINASHCHGVVRADSATLVSKAIKDATAALVPVQIGSGNAQESRISENRRMMLTDGTQADMRRAYSLPPDELVASVGPIDPAVGLLKLTRMDGTVLAVVYHFACHPIMNPPSKGSSADFPGVASKIIEGALGHGAMALFLQGCGGDINPIRYKEASRPADAEPLGALLAGTVLTALTTIPTTDAGVLKAERTELSLPRAADYAVRMTAIEDEQKRIVTQLKPTNLNFKSFLPLLIQQRMSPEMPSHHASSYLRDQAQENKAIPQLDADNQTQVEAYLANLSLMERLTRLNTNHALLKKHQAQTEAAASKTLDVEVGALRVGDFKWVTFPGEITVEVGLGIKKAAGEKHCHVSGYTNGYIYYTPTVNQRLNKGYAQEDCDTLVAPEWQKAFQDRALELFKRLGGK